jgi:hypothetical protein
LQIWKWDIILWALKIIFMNLSELKSTPITLDQAKDEIQQRKRLYKDVMDMEENLSATFHTRTNEGVETGKNFYGHTGNAFIFTKESVLRHFFNNGNFEEPTANKYLLVILAAHDKDANRFLKGNPTAIIAGAQVSENTTETSADDYVVLNIPFPADQYPPVETIEEIHSITPSIGIKLPS